MPKVNKEGLVVRDETQTSAEVSGLKKLVFDHPKLFWMIALTVFPGIPILLTIAQIVKYSQ